VINTPPAKAITLEIGGDKIALWIKTLPTMDLYEIRVVKLLDGGSWGFLTSSAIDFISTTTKEDTDAAFVVAKDKINKALAELYKKDDSAEPEKGLERLEYLLSKLTIVDDQLK